MQTELLKRVTVISVLRGGKPTIRGMRFRVRDVIDLLYNGISIQQILEEEIPDLEEDDVKDCLTYASLKVDYSVLHATTGD